MATLQLLSLHEIEWPFKFIVAPTFISLKQGPLSVAKSSDKVYGEDTQDELGQPTFTSIGVLHDVTP
jgi:hypothetical protein